MMSKRERKLYRRWRRASDDLTAVLRWNWIKADDRSEIPATPRRAWYEPDRLRSRFLRLIDDTRQEIGATTPWLTEDFRRQFHVPETGEDFWHLVHQSWQVIKRLERGPSASHFASENDEVTR